mgnify:CR=1 FL=1
MAEETAFDRMTSQISVWPDNATPQAEPAVVVAAAPPPVPDSEPAKDEPAPVEPTAVDAKADEPAPEGETEPEKAERHKRKDPQKRIDQAIARQRQAEVSLKTALAERQAAIDARAVLEARLAAIEAKVTPSLEPVAPTPAAETVLTPENFETYEAYIDALVQQRTEKAIETRLATERERLARETADRATSDALAQHQTRFERAKATHDDFEAVVGQDIALSAPMRDVIVASEEGPEMAYYLGTHPDEAARIAALPPGPALVEMGKLAVRVVAAAPAPVQASGPAPTVPPVTRVPAPIRPVGTGASASSVPLDALPLADFVARRNAEDRARGLL